MVSYHVLFLLIEDNLTFHLIYNKSVQIIYLKPDSQIKLETLKKKKIDKSAVKETKQETQELSEEEKAKQRSKPVSSTPVSGTGWCVVIIYFYLVIKCFNISCFCLAIIFFTPY